ncbi:MAG: peptide chain release factor N(5)-glutamine methyltransferase [Muribaculaceae bacterium]|nr:peptide chain release factor N(5)-glutamine methyltransferase [Muribaculaceae bacterium]
MTLSELNRHIIETLTPQLGQSEARATARLLLEDDLGVSQSALVLNPDRVLEPETPVRFDRYLSRIISGEPPQYVMGTARWMGMDIAVTPDTLIPRPETAELVDLITDDYSAADLRIADLCTGSGCIAVALARALPFAHVDAADISDGAIAIARKNAALAPAGAVNVLKANILQDIPGTDSYDIIVSNPPYVLESEMAGMESRVIDHEPHIALFVPDDDPLRFYRAIADKARNRLKAGGTLYFEINPLEVDNLKQMMTGYGFDTEFIREAQGKQRFIKARIKQ